MAGEEFASMMEDVTVEEMDTSDTQWNWYYLGECGKWHTFEDPSVPHSVNSEDIERIFRMNTNGSFSFSTAKYNYMIDFKAMKQTNTATGKQRPVTRAVFSVTAFSSVHCIKLQMNIRKFQNSLDKQWIRTKSRKFKEFRI